MSLTKSQNLVNLSESILGSIDHVIPLPNQKNFLQNPINDQLVHIHFGVKVELTGDLKGQLLYMGKPQLFSSIGETMFGMAMEGDMLNSFTGELANMLSGGLCTNISQFGITLDITTPTILAGDINLTTFREVTKIEINYIEKGQLFIYVLLESQ